MENGSMHIGLPTLESTVYEHVKKARSNMTLKQKIVYGMSGNLTKPQTLHRHYLHFGV
jgi:hypothetical protein